jgi:hypothetical protein
MRLRKPCVRLRLLRWGWNVLFDTTGLRKTRVLCDSEKGALHNTPPGRCQRRGPLLSTGQSAWLQLGCTLGRAGSHAGRPWPRVWAVPLRRRARSRPGACRHPAARRAEPWMQSMSEMIGEIAGRSELGARSHRRAQSFTTATRANTLFPSSDVRTRARDEAILRRERP